MKLYKQEVFKVPEALALFARRIGVPREIPGTAKT